MNFVQNCFRQKAAASKIFAAALVFSISLSLAGCAKDDMLQEKTGSQSGEKISFNISSPENSSGSKVEYTDGAAGASGTLTWQSGDQLAAVGFNGSTYKGVSKDFTLQPGGDGNTTGTFAGTAVTGATSYNVYYPADVDVTTAGVASLNMDGQRQNGDNNTAHLKNFTLLEAKNATPSGSFVMTMKSSIMKFAITNVPTDVGELQTLTLGVETESGVIKYKTMSFDNVTFSSSVTSLTAYMSFLNTDISGIIAGGKLSVMLSGKGKTYTYTTTASTAKEYKEGKRYTATIDMGESGKVTSGAYMIYTVKTTEASTTVPLCFFSDRTVTATLTIEWGDGETGSITSGTKISASGSASHTYENAGTYSVKITSSQADATKQQIPDYHFDDSYSGTLCKYLVSIDTPLLNSKQAFYYCFNNCAELASIPSGLFDKNTSATSFSQCFRGCTNLVSIPAGLFDKNTAVTDFSSCFSGCTNLTSMPAGVFDKNINVTDFSGCFTGCTNLASIPAGLFDKNTEVTTFYVCFYNCTNLASIPAGLFDKNTKVTTFQECFYGCTNLASIPANLFDKNTKATTFQSCLSKCKKLTSIPAGLFDKNTEVTDFSYCLSSCEGITSIPEGLFDNNTKATNFRNCFYNCASLTSIPTGLFDKNTAVTNFSGCFKSSKLTSIPTGLFDKNTAVTDFSSCFYGCENLKLNKKIFSSTGAIDRFSGKTVTFSKCFYRAGYELTSGNQGEAPELWKYTKGSGSWTTTDCFTEAYFTNNTTADGYDATVTASWGTPK